MDERQVDRINRLARRILASDASLTWAEASADVRCDCRESARELVRRIDAVMAAARQVNGEEE